MMGRTCAARRIRCRRGIAALGPLLPLLGLLAGGCEEVPLGQAPIVEHSMNPGKPPAAGVTTAPPATREAHDGNYLVQRGDTLYSIALAFGQDFRDIARWSGLDDPTRIKVGQMLRVAPPAGGAAPAGGVGVPPATASPDAETSAEVTAIPIAPPSGAVQTRPLDSIETAPAAPPAATSPPAAGTAGAAASTAAPAAASPGAGAVPPLAAAAPAAPTPAPPASTAKPSPAEAPLAEPSAGWTWPAAGKVLDRFDAARNKGIDIGGSVGSTVVAANDGQIVYVGNGLRGYGNLVIIKHTDDYVSAYAHNQQILVKQGQTVKRGQPIAELGMTDAPDARLHFEIRRKGKPVDPLAYLPPR